MFWNNQSEPSYSRKIRRIKTQNKNPDFIHFSSSYALLGLLIAEARGKSGGLKAYWLLDTRQHTRAESRAKKERE